MSLTSQVELAEPKWNLADDHLKNQLWEEVKKSTQILILGKKTLLNRPLLWTSFWKWLLRGEKEGTEAGVGTREGSF